MYNRNDVALIINTFDVIVKEINHNNVGSSECAFMFINN